MGKKGKIQENKYKIEFVDRVLDPVHGFIDLTQVEKEIIELPIFKRLQSLKQLSLTNWVFPGAEHTRYMHSLGVMHIVDLMAINIRTLDYKQVYNDGQRQLLRLAGLLHDIGHYPLSHVTEYVYNSKLLEEKQSLYDHNQIVKAEINELNSNEVPLPDYMKDRYSKPMHHESMGTKVIKSDKNIISIISKYCPFINIDDICDIIVGCVDRNPKISSMVQLIHSEVDADGIDYIMRDATFSGTSYGGFELGLLLRNLVIEKYNGIDIVGIRPKGISVVDQYLVSKYFAYTQVIFNRHVAIYDTMAEMFTKALIRLSKSTYPNASQLLSYVNNHCTNDEYLKFTDRTFWTQLDSLNTSDVDLGDYVSKYIVNIHDKLQHYKEFESKKSEEFVITSNKRRKVFNSISNQIIYKHLDNADEKSLLLFHTKGFTNEIPKDEYLERVNAIYKTPISEKEFIENYNTKRLQEGVAIIESNSAMHLLVDDTRSIMSHLYDTKTYILREYYIS